MKLHIILTLLSTLFLPASATQTTETEKYCGLSQTESTCSQHFQDKCFKAAVVEYPRIDRANISESIEINLRFFDEAIEIASQHGAQIIVFPEDGIFMGTVNQITPALEEIPDPGTLDGEKNPCLHAISGSMILKKLSCMAKKHKIYVVANFGTKQSCERGELIGDRVCPQVGYLRLNTDVVFDSEGNFIKRYRKFNLFIEVFEYPPTLETVYFDSPFGRFGLITCFDMMFKKPAVELVERHKIDTMLFPTWWYDELPLLSAIQFQDGWSETHKVNLLASNILRPSLGSVGSGIFSGDFSAYTSPSNTRAKLIIARIPKHPRENANCDSGPDALTEDIGDRATDEAYQFKSYSMLDQDKLYVMRYNEARETVCDGSFCCTIDYEASRISENQFEDKLVLIVRNNLRPGAFHWHEQVCALATLESPYDDRQPRSSIKYSPSSGVKFDRLSIEATFDSKYVYPITAHNVTELVHRSGRDFACDPVNRERQFACKLDYRGPETKPVVVFGLYGRLYERDEISEITT